MAFKDGCQKANPVLLEPMMKVEVTVPDDYLGDVMGNISSRRGNLTGIEMAQRHTGDTRLYPAVRNVRLCDGSEKQNSGQRQLYDAV